MKWSNRKAEGGKVRVWVWVIVVALLVGSIVGEFTKTYAGVSSPSEFTRTEDLINVAGHQLSRHIGNARAEQVIRWIERMVGE